MRERGSGDRKGAALDGGARLSPTLWRMTADPRYWEDIQSQRHPGFGRCIYCGDAGGGGSLREEHIIPLSLGGKTVIEAASCESCEKITSYLDGYLGRHVFYDYRLHTNAPTRHPKERPTTREASFLLPDGDRTIELPISDHPWCLALPVWGVPGFLRGVQPSEQFPNYFVHGYTFIPENMRATLKLKDGEPFRVNSSGGMNHTTFARAIAKIAYCHAALQYGLDGFRHLAVPGIIRGTYPCVPYFVGADLSDPPPPSQRGMLHAINFSELTTARLRLLMLSIRLFAHSGTKQHGMPIYQVLTGAPRP